MTGPFFVDTNLLVYAKDLEEAAKRQKAIAWLDALWDAHLGRVSFQVLVETYSALTHSSKVAMRPKAAREYVDSLFAWEPLVVDGPLLLSAWSIQDRYRFSWWDCLIVAAAKLARCTHLLTEDLQHGQDLEGLHVVDPFRVAPQEILSRLP